MPDLTAAQGQLVAYVVGLASDRPGMSQRQVLDDLVAGYEATDPGRGFEAAAHRWQVTPEELAEVAGVLDEAQSRPAVMAPPAAPRRTPAANRPEPSWPVECSDVDAYGTCLHRLAAGYVLDSQLCQGCNRQYMNALDAVVPGGLPWHQSRIERAGMPAEEVSLR